MNTWDKTVTELKAACKEQNIKGYSKLKRMELVYLLDSKSTAPPRSPDELMKQMKVDLNRIKLKMEKTVTTPSPNHYTAHTITWKTNRARKINAVFQAMLEARFSFFYRFTPVQGERVGTRTCFYSATATKSAGLLVEMGTDDNKSYNTLRTTLAEYQTKSKAHGMTILLSLNRHLPHDMVRLIAQDFI